MINNANLINFFVIENTSINNNITTIICAKSGSSLKKFKIDSNISA